MKKIIIIYLTALSILFTNFVFAENIVALVDLKFIKDTEITSQVMCYSDDNCHTWATYYLYTASVKKVISGEPPEGNFKVIYGSHALLKKDFSNVLATLEPLEPENQFSAQYKVIELEWEHDF